MTNRSRIALPLHVTAVALWLVAAALAQTSPPAQDVVSVRADRPGAAIAPTTFGVFFEDINFAADGGLSPERIRNRSFEFNEPLAGWSKGWQAENSLDQPARVAPVESRVSLDASGIRLDLPPQSLNVLRLPRGR